MSAGQHTGLAEQDPESAMTQGFAIPGHQIQKPLPESKMSTLDELEDSYADLESGLPAAPTRQKTGGRQKGTPNKVQRFELARGCKIYGIEALATLVEIMRGAPDENGAMTATNAERMKAASEILDRGYGKAKQVTEHTGLDGGDIQTKLTIEFIGQPPINARVDAQIEDRDGKTIDMQLETVRVPEQRKPWDPA